jgi:hypothetical protein
VTFAAPTTTVPCGNTYVRATGYTIATAVSGSIGYRFSFYQGSTLVGQRAQASNYIYFGQVAGLSANQTYTWTVEVQYNSSSGPAYGPPSSSSCTVTFGPGSIIVDDNNNNQSNLRQELISTDDSAETTSVLVFPNPTSGAATIDGNGQLIDQLIITDISGRIVFQSAPKNSICQVDLKNEEDGIYFVTVLINDSKKVVKIIKND